MAEPQSAGSVEQPQLQRTLPPMSQEEHLERLRHDIDTVLQLQLHRWSDDAWRPVADALAEYGFGVIRGWMHSRQIFAEVSRVGYGVKRCPDGWLDEETIAELAGETVAEAIRYFKFEILMPGKWEARKGASLATYFVGQCKLQFPNVYKAWFTDRKNHRDTDLFGELPPAASAGLDPGAQLVDKEAVRALLGRLSSPRARRVIWKRYLGYSCEEIAATTDGVKDAKAVENLIFREKRRLQKDGQKSSPKNEDAGK